MHEKQAIGGTKHRPGGRLCVPGKVRLPAEAEGCLLGLLGITQVGEQEQRVSHFSAL